MEEREEYRVPGEGENESNSEDQRVYYLMQEHDPSGERWVEVIMPYTEKELGRIAFFVEQKDKHRPALLMSEIRAELLAEVQAGKFKKPLDELLITSLTDREMFVLAQYQEIINRLGYILHLRWLEAQEEKQRRMIARRRPRPPLPPSPPTKPTTP